MRTVVVVWKTIRLARNNNGKKRLNQLNCIRFIRTVFQNSSLPDSVFYTAFRNRKSHCRFHRIYARCRQHIRSPRNQTKHGTLVINFLLKIASWRQSVIIFPLSIVNFIHIYVSKYCENTAEKQRIMLIHLKIIVHSTNTNAYPTIGLIVVFVFKFPDVTINRNQIWT